MRKLYSFSLLMLLLLIAANRMAAQGTVSVTTGASIVIADSAFVVLDNMHISNYGTIQSAGTSTTTLTGSISVTFAGTGTTTFGNLALVKGAATVTLTTDINVLTTLRFQSGLFNLGNNVTHLGTTGILLNESEASRALTTGTGYIEAKGTLNTPSSANPGNLGAIITSAHNLGFTIIRRGHRVFSNVSGGNPSIRRYYDIMPASNTNLNATLRLKYFDAELNGLNELTLGEWKTNDNVTWTPVRCFFTRDPVQDYVEATNVGTLTRTTLSTTILSPVTAVLGNVNVTCFGNSNGSINVSSVAGGYAPYTFSDDGTNYITQPSSGPTFTGLPANIYNITVRDDIGCTWSIGTATITQPTALTYTVAQGSPVTCNNSTTSLTITPSGGTPGYTYSLDGGAPQNSNVLTAGLGNHIVAVTDAAGCQSSTTVTVSGSASLSFNYTGIVNNTCYNGISGQVGASAIGSAGNITYTLTAPNNTTSTLSGASGNVVTFTGLAAGNYTVTATDASNCPAVTIASVSQPAAMPALNNTNNAPDLLLTSVINPPTATFNPGSTVTITYTVSVKSNGNIAAQGVILRISKPFSGYTITLTPGTSSNWTIITDNSLFTEIQLKPGLQIPCSGSMSAGIMITRAGMDSKSAGLPVTASVRLPGSNPDMNDFDNARSSQFRVQ